MSGCRNFKRLPVYTKSRTPPTHQKIGAPLKHSLERFENHNLGRTLPRVVLYCRIGHKTSSIPCCNALPKMCGITSAESTACVMQHQPFSRPNPASIHTTRFAYRARLAFRWCTCLRTVPCLRTVHLELEFTVYSSEETLVGLLARRQQIRNGFAPRRPARSGTSREVVHCQLHSPSQLSQL